MENHAKKKRIKDLLTSPGVLQFRTNIVMRIRIDTL